MQPHPVLEILPQFDVVSFDVFDTLLLRPFTKPTDLFDKLERDFGAKGFSKARARAERNAHRKARASGRIEATFDEIYALIPQWEAMKERELAAEESCWTANPEMIDVWRKAKSDGKRIVVATDMYLPAPLIQRALRERGFGGWDAFYLSSELQTQKHTGGMFDRILADARVAPDRILHIGDHPVADIRRANERGIVAYRKPRVFDRFLEECPFVRTFLGKNPSLDQRLFSGAIALGWHLFKCNRPEWSYWNRLGFLFAGPLGYAYMRFVGEDAKRRRFGQLLFAARDGYVLQKIFSVLYPEIKTKYFFASREQALFAAGYFGRTDYGIGIRRRHCLRFLEEQMGHVVSKRDAQHYMETGRLPSDAQEVLDSVSIRMRKEAQEYLGSFSIDPSSTALVDGNSVHFTIQHFVSDIVGHDMFTYYLFTSHRVNCGAAFARESWDARYQRLSEFLFGAPTPPVERVEGGKPVWKGGLPFFERYKMSASDAIADGAVEASRILNSQRLVIPYAVWLDWNDSFMDNQSTEDAEVLSLACNSVAIAHNGEFRNIVVSPETPRVYRLFGCKVLTVTRKRFGIVYRREGRLFGYLTIFRMSQRWWNRAAKVRGLFHPSKTKQA